MSSVAVPTFIKFTTGANGDCPLYYQNSNKYRYVEGENVADRAAGLYFTTLAHFTDWIEVATHVWAVSLPEGEVIRVESAGKLTANRIIMTNCQPINTFLESMPDSALKVSTKGIDWNQMRKIAFRYPAIYRAFAPKLLHHIKGVMCYEHIVVTERPSGEYKYVGVYINDSLFPVRTSAGTVFHCNEFRNGYAFGPGVWVNRDGTIIYTGTFNHGVFHGSGTENEKPCEFEDGAPKYN